MTVENNKKKKEDEPKPPELTKKEDSTSKQPPQPPAGTTPIDLFRSLPPDAQKAFTGMISMVLQSGPLPNPILSKITEEHIGKVIDNAEQDSVRNHQGKILEMKWGFWTLVVVLIFALALAVGCLVSKHFEYIVPIITAIIGGGGGIGIGYGIAKRST
jgi:hypothetical protein